MIILWEYRGNALGMLQERHGNSKGISYAYRSNNIKIFREYHRTTIGILEEQHGNSMGIS